MKANSFTNYIGTGMLAACATIGQAWMVSAARAAETPAPQSIRVSVRDLDLSNSAGVKTLYRRIDHAAKEVCISDFVTSGRLPTQEELQCVAQAVNGAVTDINNAMLSAYHKRETTKIGA